MLIQESCDTSVRFHQTTLRHTPEDSHLRGRHDPNIKSCYTFNVSY
jgi:hypothetical protein